MAVGFPLNSGIAQNFVRGVALCAGLLLAGCAAPPAPSGVNDPNEGFNRKVHAFNLAMDKTLVKPGAKGYDGIVPKPVKRGVSNVANTLELPADIANNVLQFRFVRAGVNTLKLAVNLTMGVGGLFDASTAIGLPDMGTDFGETLHVWGVPEGAYVELPLLGPSTGRDAVGTVVDFAISPTRHLFPDLPKGAATGAKILSRLGDRARYSDTVDSILYESADSYAQARLLYLQNRRFELGQDAAADASGAYDPYEDPYAE
jgi:phospholipid-binding lipoprotein MlaA